MAFSRRLMGILLVLVLVASGHAAPWPVDNVVGNRAPKPQGHWETVAVPDTLDLRSGRGWH